LKEGQAGGASRQPKNQGPLAIQRER